MAKIFLENLQKEKILITNLNKLYKKTYIFFSLEYENILDIKKFKSNKLFNLHFSILPKYRGCHTNYYQILYGERKSGVTLHEIDRGIDTGKIIDKQVFKVDINATSYNNYLKLLEKSVTLFKKNIKKILEDTYFKRQNLNKGAILVEKV